MNYLISTFDGVLYNNQVFNFFKNVKYKIKTQKDSVALIFPSYNAIPFILDLKNESENVLKVKYGCDNYYFLFAQKFSKAFAFSFKFKNKNISISLSNTLCVVLEDVLICEKIVDNLSYSHYEIVGELCLIYFSGKRNFLVVLKDNELCFANYYDECNIKDNEKYFMCKLYDSLNHGLVCEIKDKEISQYLVYLDDYDMNLKDEFLPLVFLDCVKAGNYKYCNELLSDGLKLKNEKGIKEFFPMFDFCFPINERVIILANKNTLAGIYEFEIENNKIFNIHEC